MSEANKNPIHRYFIHRCITAMRNTDVDVEKTDDDYEKYRQYPQKFE